MLFDRIQWLVAFMNLFKRLGLSRFHSLKLTVRSENRPFAKMKLYIVFQPSIFVHLQTAVSFRDVGFMTIGIHTVWEVNPTCDSCGCLFVRQVLPVLRSSWKSYHGQKNMIVAGPQKQIGQGRLLYKLGLVHDLSI